jgi:hypothetical protein
MPEATNEVITNTKTPNVELTPERLEYVGANQVLVTLKTNTGDLVTFTLTTAMMMNLVNLSMKLVNNTTAQVFRDLGVL